MNRVAEIVKELFEELNKQGYDMRNGYHLLDGTRQETIHIYKFGDEVDISIGTNSLLIKNLKLKEEK
jgi:hypothetical protein